MEMEDIYRRHAQTVYKFLLAQCRDADLADGGDLLSGSALHRPL